LNCSLFFGSKNKKSCKFPNILNAANISLQNQSRKQETVFQSLVLRIANKQIVMKIVQRMTYDKTLKKYV
jgi:hypothetical protein